MRYVATSPHSPIRRGIIIRPQFRGEVSEQSERRTERFTSPFLRPSIPLLIVIFRNRSYYNDEEHEERTAQLRGRPVENKIYGIRIEQSEVDFATTARTFGIWSTGPVTAPGELSEALREALKVVKGSKPAVVEVACAMRT